MSTPRFVLTVAVVMAVGSGGGCGRRPIDSGEGVVDIGADAGVPVAAPTPAAGTDGGTGGAAVVAPCAAAPAAAGWTEVKPPAGIAGLEVRSAWAAADDDIFFAGGLSDEAATAGVVAGPRVLRWSKGCWTLEVVGPPTDASLASVSGTAADDVWATTGADLWHRDAAGWSVVDGGWRSFVSVPGQTTTTTLTEVRALDRDEVWVIGMGDGYGGVYDGLNTFVLRWRSGTWRGFTIDEIKPDRLPDVNFFYFSTMWVAGADDVWIGGSYESLGFTMEPGLFVHYDGQAWTTGGLGYPKWPGGFAGLPGGDIWMAAAGGNNWGQKGPSLLRYAAGGWTWVVVDALPWTAEGMGSVWARAPGDVWAAGADVIRGDGSSFAVVDDVPSAVRHTATLVTGDSRSVWLVGAGPSFFRTDLRRATP